MNKLIVILTVLVFGTLITSNANAGIFDWISENSDSASAKELTSFDKLYANLTNLKIVNLENKKLATIQSNFIPETGNHVTPKTKGVISKKFTVSMSAYSSTVDQTDSSPFITAAGTHVRDGIVAANFLPFGTRIKIPSIFGDKIFVVEDRMNKRYWYNMDIWFSNRQSALEFGRKTVEIEIVS